MRMFVYGVLRKQGQENDLLAPPSPYRAGNRLFAMPLLCGDDPLSNEAPSKGLRLTDTMLVMIRQWRTDLDNAADLLVARTPPDDRLKTYPVWESVWR
jgi:hypothetical protein